MKPTSNEEVWKWPTFRGGTLNEENHLRMLKTLGDILDAESSLAEYKLIQVSSGWRYVRESKNGGFVNGGGTRNSYRVFSIELQAYVTSKQGRRSPMYAQVWVGGYGKGSIMHLAWQFPHERKFLQSDLDFHAKRIYEHIANLVYNGRPMDKEVTKFIQEEVR